MFNCVSILINLNHALLIGNKWRKKIPSLFPFSFEGAENFLQYLLSYCVLISVINTLGANSFGKKTEVPGQVAKADSPQ